MSRRYPFWRGLWHAGLGPATYACGITGALLQLTDRWTQTPAVELTLALSATLAGAFGLMLLDRVKWRDDLMDPADALADPRRIEFLKPHIKRWRAVAIVSAVIGAALAWIPGGVVGCGVVLLGLGAIALYAGKPANQRPSPFRLKDIPLVKNVFVGVGLVSLSLAIVHGRDVQAAGSGEALATIGYLLLVVIFDAMLCDIPDADADRAHGVRTLPVLLGDRCTRVIAIAGLAVSGLAWSPISGQHSEGVSGLWASAPTVTAVLAMSLPTPWLKSLIDIRPACITIAGAMLLVA